MSTELIVGSAQREDTQAWLTLWRGYCAALDPSQRPTTRLSYAAYLSGSTRLK
jgi:hypothetical protein